MNAPEPAPSNGPDPTHEPTPADVAADPATPQQATGEEQAEQNRADEPPA